MGRKSAIWMGAEEDEVEDQIREFGDVREDFRGEKGNGAWGVRRM
jgi:hypothetical protein